MRGDERIVALTPHMARFIPAPHQFHEATVASFARRTLLRASAKAVLNWLVRQ